MAIASTAWPERIQAAAATAQRLAAQNVYFVPVRHHSPACSMALQQWLHALQPKRVLIEAPHAFMPLLPLLLQLGFGMTPFQSGSLTFASAAGAITMKFTAPQIVRAFDNLKAVAEAAGGSLADVVKLNVYLVDLGNFAKVNAAMATYFSEPFPARAAIGVASLPRGGLVEMDGVLVLGS